MGSPWVHETEGSPLLDLYGLPVHVGVDYSSVTIRTGAGGATLDAARLGELVRLLASAGADSVRNAALLAEEAS